MKVQFVLTQSEAMSGCQRQIILISLLDVICEM